MLFLFVFICDTTSIFCDKSHMSTLTESQYLSEKHCKCLTATFSQLDLKVLAFIQQWQADWAMATLWTYYLVCLEDNSQSLKK